MSDKKRNFSVIEYFRRQAEALQPEFRFQGRRAADFGQWQEQLLARLKEALGPMPEPVDLNPEIVWEVEEDGLIKRRVLLDFEEHMSAAALLYIPEAALKKAGPAILCNHGHGAFGKDAVMGLRPVDNAAGIENITVHNYDYGLQMARRGYVTIAIDWRCFGERADGGAPYPNRDLCNVHFIRGSMMGVNMLALDIFDARRTLDYLETLDCVDGERIGTMGLSFGGTMTTWIALMDQRIKAADIICYSDRFGAFAVGNGNICGSQMVPSLFRLCDVADLQGLIAPRPLLAEVGTEDQCFQIEDALSCTRAVAEIYAAAGAAENYEVDMFVGGHQFGGNKAFDFFERHLKG